MKIGELSRRCEVSIRMLRYYEEEGLLKPQRSPSGFREYGPREEQTVERIKLLGSAGMTLATIKQFLPCIRGEGHLLEPCDELRSTLIEQIALVDQKTENSCRAARCSRGFCWKSSEPSQRRAIRRGMLPSSSVSRAACSEAEPVRTPTQKNSSSRR